LVEAHIGPAKVFLEDAVSQLFDPEHFKFHLNILDGVRFLQVLIIKGTQVKAFLAQVDIAYEFCL
jgi:hypothetical protein